MLQFRNLDRVMETVTISKNGASSKSRMSRRNFLGKACFALLLASFVLAGCNKENDNNSSSSNSSSMIDGTYIHENHTAYKIVLKGTSWTSMISNENYGKGTYTLSNDNKVSGRSTHAWIDGTWVSYTGDTFSGTYDEESNSFTITTTGYDTDFNGTYLRQ